MTLKTEDDAFDEFCDLIISNPAENYIYNNYIKKGCDFYYLSTKFFQWCRDYEDLKHIVRSKIPIR